MNPVVLTHSPEVDVSSLLALLGTPREVSPTRAVIDLAPGMVPRSDYDRFLVTGGDLIIEAPSAVDRDTFVIAGGTDDAFDEMTSPMASIVDRWIDTREEQLFDYAGSPLGRLEAIESEWLRDPRAEEIEPFDFAVERLGIAETLALVDAAPLRLLAWGDCFEQGARAHRLADPAIAQALQTFDDHVRAAVAAGTERSARKVVIAAYVAALECVHGTTPDPIVELVRARVTARMVEVERPLAVRLASIPTPTPRDDDAGYHPEMAVKAQAHSMPAPWSDGGATDAERLASAQHVVTAVSSDVINDRLRSVHPGSVVGKFMRAAELKTQGKFSPMLAFGTFVPFMSQLFGRHWYAKSAKYRTHPNVYMGGLAASGSSKSTALGLAQRVFKRGERLYLRDVRNAAIEILQAEGNTDVVASLQAGKTGATYTEPTKAMVDQYGADLVKRVGFSRPLSGGWFADFTGSAALHQSLNTHPTAVIVNDEPEIMFRRVYGANASTSMVELSKHLRTLTTDVEGELLARRYAGGVTVPPVIAPHVSMAVVGTNRAFWEALPEACYGDGTLGRYALLEEDGEVSESIEIDLFDDGEEQALETLEEQLAAWVADVLRVRCPDPLLDPTIGGLITETKEEQRQRPDFVAVDFTNEAKRLQNAFANAHRRAFESAAKANRTDAALWQRSNETGMKLALILALSRNVHTPVITPGDVEFASWIALHSTARIAKRVTTPERGDIDPKFARARETVLGRVREATATAGYLRRSKAIERVGSEAFAELVIQSLVNAGEIREEVVKGNRRYVATVAPAE